MDIFRPIQLFSDMATYGWLNLNENSYLGSAVNFFIYDTIKIGLLLIVINYVMAITRYYFPMEAVREMLTKRRWLGLDYLFAALLGIVTPFCSCSSIPLFIGFLGAGIPLGVTLAFLISSPLVNEASLILFPAMFGMKITVIYNIVGILISIVGGFLISRMKMERFLVPELLKFKSKREVEAEYNERKIPFSKLAQFWFEDGMRITKEVFPYVVLGVAIGALIHGFVPDELAVRYLSVREWWVVPIAVLLGAPLYANSVSVIPVVEALTSKGVPLGTALAFMTSIVTVSIPQALILKKVMKLQLLGMFMGITIMGIIIMGYLFNWLV